MVDLSGQQDVRSEGKRKNSRINNLLTALLVVIVWPGGLQRAAEEENKVHYVINI